MLTPAELETVIAGFLLSLITVLACMRLGLYRPMSWITRLAMDDLNVWERRLPGAALPGFMALLAVDAAVAIPHLAVRVSIGVAAGLLALCSAYAACCDVRWLDPEEAAMAHSRLPFEPRGRVLVVILLTIVAAATVGAMLWEGQADLAPVLAALLAGLGGVLTTVPLSRRARHQSAAERAQPPRG